MFDFANSYGDSESEILNDVSTQIITKDIVIVPTIVYIEKDDPVPMEEVKPRYGFTDEDIYLLAQLLCGGKTTDGDGEYDIDFQKSINYYEVSKVLGVVMNRVRSDDFPDTVREVVLQKGQFGPMPRNLMKEPSDIALQTVREWCMAYDNYMNFVQIVPENHLYFAGNGVINKTRANYK
jgi:hypothetical protein